MQPLNFRYNAALVVAFVVVFVGAVPLVASLPYLVPILLVPVGLGLWAWRAGTDATADGLRIRALRDHRRVRLPAVGAADLARLREQEPTAQ